MDPLIKSQLLYQLSYAPTLFVGEYDLTKVRASSKIDGACEGLLQKLPESSCRGTIPPERDWFQLNWGIPELGNE